MAKIEVVGFVSDWKYGEKDPNPNWAMKISEPHSKKEGDKWVKNGSTNYTVKAAYGVEIDFSEYRQGDRVEVKGTQVSEEWESNGKKGKNLIIKASSVELLQSGQHEHRQPGTFEKAVAAPFDVETPF
jgi:hypothetical protein